MAHENDNTAPDDRREQPDAPRDAAAAGSPGAAFGHHRNPRVRVEAEFSRIARTRMAGVPICNPALQVETIGFQRWQDEWLGILITPWALNLMLLPGGGDAFRALWPGDSQWWQFPSGAYEFLGNREPGLGPYQVCSLFSPVFEFATQDAARDTARAALAALFVPGGAAQATAAAAPDAPPLSRRAFLRTLLAGPRE
jgi:[NiFe] hydrogenase assembly HybE family chaperone